jgi:hypothetical protein
MEEPVKLTIKRVGDGLHSSEVVIEVRTVGGSEQLVVDSSHLNGNELKVGWPVGSKADQFLVELPNETFRGQWRVWVPKKDVILDRERAIA